MLKDVLISELSSLELDVDELLELEEEMAAGVGCRNASCAGSCSSRI